MAMATSDEMSLAFVDVEHPLTETMKLAGFRRDPHTPIVCLKQRKKPNLKSAIYKVGVLDRSVTTVVAKRCSNTTASIEKRIYESVLTTLRVTRPAYYGCVPETNSGFSWLFLGYVDGEPWSPKQDDHCQAGTSWLAKVHTAAATCVSVESLPDRGSDHYLAHLQLARTNLMETANQEMSAAGRDVLELVLRSLQDVESRWGEIDEISAAMVPTLVHGDFVPKNVRVKRGRARSFSL